MDSETDNSTSFDACSELSSKRHKRMKALNREEDYNSSDFSAYMHNDTQQKPQKTESKDIDYFEPFAIPNLLQGLDKNKFGSVTEDIKALCARKMQIINTYIAMKPTLPLICLDEENNQRWKPLDLVKPQLTHLAGQNVINQQVTPRASQNDIDQHVTHPAHQKIADLEDDCGGNDVTAISPSIVIIDSDDENDGDQRPSPLYQNAVLREPSPLYQKPTLPLICLDEENIQNRKPLDLVKPQLTHLAGQNVINQQVTHRASQNVVDQHVTHPAHQKIIDLEDDCGGNDVTAIPPSIMIVDSDDENNGDQRPSPLYQKVVLREHVVPMKEDMVIVEGCNRSDTADDSLVDNCKDDDMTIAGGSHEADSADDGLANICKDMDMVISEGSHQTDAEDDGLEDNCAYNDMVIAGGSHHIDAAHDGLSDIWREMAFALECSKDIFEDPVADKQMKEDEFLCDHSFVLKDDLGYVCRICGVIQRSIETIFDFVYSKGKRTTRTYMHESQNSNTRNSAEIFPGRVKSPGDNSVMTKISVHPRHGKQMKPHQVEGFNFLCSNLVTDDPGGCILAHAPGSGKTFMIISFMQSFLAKYPDARPLVVLPKGILETWKKEFKTWQVEDIPLHDFYTSKAETRSQQLIVLKKWVAQKSILFLGYNQLSVIFRDKGDNKVEADCQEILLKVPTVLIIDEGHTPRNDDTDVFQSLARVQTPRKVVLSGTLYQNHVKEVFNILNLVRPKFLKLPTSRAVVSRIMSRVKISGTRKYLKACKDLTFFELVEQTLQDENSTRKVAVIQDLREMTSQVLHYYKGDFLDELPGLFDFTVMLNLSTKQKDEVNNLGKLDKFKQISVGSALYMHPRLKYFSENYQATGDRSSFGDDEKIDEMLENLDVRNGVKLKFFLNILGLCESAGEKLLVFSQYILPLKFLERLSVKVKGWSPGKELYMITGDSNSEHREWSMERFNNSPDAKVFFGSIKACGEGISLVGASRVLILDVHLNPSVTRQAIGRAFRPGQKRKVYTYRLIAADSPEEKDYLTCYRKELISKMWFEWNENCGCQDSEVQTVEVDECGDLFLESPNLREDVKVLYKR